MTRHAGSRTRFTLTAGLLALAAAAPAAFADPAGPPAPPPPPHEMGPPKIDLNGDGYLTRDEARAAAEKMFEHLDTNKDGKLDSADRPMHGPGHMRREEFTEEREDGDGKIERRVEIRREGPGDHHMRHMGPPMAMMMFMSREEADLNHDGALSKDEFVNMQLRFFDAADVNGDGRIKLDLPRPPEPPLPPAPAQPPRR